MGTFLDPSLLLGDGPGSTLAISWRTRIATRLVWARQGLPQHWVLQWGVE